MAHFFLAVPCQGNQTSSYAKDLEEEKAREGRQVNFTVYSLLLNSWNIADTMWNPLEPSNQFFLGILIQRRPVVTPTSGAEWVSSSSGPSPERWSSSLSSSPTSLSSVESSSPSSSSSAPHCTQVQPRLHVCASYCSQPLFEASLVCEQKAIIVGCCNILFKESITMQNTEIQSQKSGLKVASY